MATPAIPSIQPYMRAPFPVVYFWFKLCLHQTKILAIDEPGRQNSIPLFTESSNIKTIFHRHGRIW